MLTAKHTWPAPTHPAVTIYSPVSSVCRPISAFTDGHLPAGHTSGQADETLPMSYGQYAQHLPRAVPCRRTAWRWHRAAVGLHKLLQKSEGVPDAAKMEYTWPPSAENTSCPEYQASYHVVARALSTELLQQLQRFRNHNPFRNSRERGIVLL